MTDFSFIVGPVSRILLRVVAGVIIGRGLPNDWVEEFIRDPSVLMTAEIIVGAAVWAVVEIYYIVARRLGWAT